MKAVVVERPGAVTVKDVPEPAVGDNEIVLRVRSASICNATDNHIVSGEFAGYHDHYPQILGHEVCGDVVAIGPHVAFGPNVEGVSIGERLVTYTPNGAFCEYTTVPADWAWARVPDSIPDDVAPACEMFHGSLIGTVYTAGLQPGERVAVIGAGPMGLVTLQALKALADVTVGVVERIPFRVERARQLGADFTYDNSQLTRRELVARMGDELGGPPDLVCICTATDESPEQNLFDVAVDLVRPGGRITGLTVDVKGLAHRVGILDLFHKRVQLARTLHPNVYGADDSPASDHDVFQMGVDWVERGTVDIAGLITHRFGMSEVEEGLRLCRDAMDRTIKVVLDPADLVTS
jgi:threonine dehydrogenase-like Zn-dependent dehydrogenase